MKKIILNLFLLIIFIRSIYILIEWFNGNSTQSPLIIFIYFAIIIGVILVLIYHICKIIIEKYKKSKNNDF
ncbi:putative integral membrane protein [Staphylococcus epidermidis]|nr:hypothetical protein [Staphylococcus epidermidis]